MARSFVRNKLAPSLVEEEGWDYVVLSKNNHKQHAWTWNTKLFSFDCFREDFIIFGFYANMKLLSKYATVVQALEQNHCVPDGILLKLKETGNTKRLKESTVSSIARLKVDDFRNGKDLRFPIVEGDLEIVEIKCGRKARLFKKQKETYNNLIAKNVPLRLIRVRIVSFDLNRFLVEEHKYEKFL
ncbi:MAG: hypothetical protein JSV51_01325 [Candidatus Bathyarchaeota archaeon]|nr:MAG: hypothetical protein JSV51_01325 [Candidatus Bathyarchaeota archaeon]